MYFKVIHFLSDVFVLKYSDCSTLPCHRAVFCPLRQLVVRLLFTDGQSDTQWNYDQVCQTCHWLGSMCDWVLAFLHVRVVLESSYRQSRDLLTFSWSYELLARSFVARMGKRGMHKQLHLCMNSVWVKLRVFRKQRRWSSWCSCPPLLLERVTGHSGEQLLINEHLVVLWLVR